MSQILKRKNKIIGWQELELNKVSLSENSGKEYTQ